MDLRTDGRTDEHALVQWSQLKRNQEKIVLNKGIQKKIVGEKTRNKNTYLKPECSEEEFQK